MSVFAVFFFFLQSVYCVVFFVISFWRPVGYSFGAFPQTNLKLFRDLLRSFCVLQSCKYQAFPSHLLINRKRQQSTCRYPPWRGGRWQAQLFPGFGGRQDPDSFSPGPLWLLWGIYREAVHIGGLSCFTGLGANTPHLSPLPPTLICSVISVCLRWEKVFYINERESSEQNCISL